MITFANMLRVDEVGGDFTLAGASLSFGSVRVGLLNPSRRVTVEEASSVLTFGGRVTDGGLTKAGAGTLALTGNDREYTGDTTVEAGTLSIGDGTFASALTVNEGAALVPAFDNTSDPDFFIFAYRRSHDAAADTNTTITAEYGSDFTGWTEALAGPDIQISVNENGAGAGIDLVEVKIRRTLAIDGRLFARLKVEVEMP